VVVEFAAFLLTYCHPYDSLFYCASSDGQEDAVSICMKTRRCSEKYSVCPEEN